MPDLPIVSADPRMCLTDKNPSLSRSGMIALCFAGALLFCEIVTVQAEELAPHSRVEWAGVIESRGLNESSGLAASKRQQNVLWSMNDSGGNAELFALSTSGKHLGSWMLDMPKPSDWEAMTSFVWEQNPYLLVADIGDNFAVRGQVSYTIIPEPDIEKLAPDARLKPVQTQTFTYPDGPRDSEAIAVDADQGEILIMSKRTKPIELYRLPLDLGRNSGPPRPMPDRVAEKITSLNGLEKPDQAAADLYGDAWPFLAMPTGMSLHGNRLLVTTLEHALLYDRRNWAAPPQRIALPYIGQREAITFAGDKGEVAYLTHEREYGMRHAHLLRLTLSPPE